MTYSMLSEFQESKKSYFEQIDFIKALAITSVIVLHTISPERLLDIFTPFHMWQAVPAFMMLAGMTSTLSIRSLAARPDRAPAANRWKKKLLGYVRRLIVPFTAIWLVQAVLLLVLQKDDLNTILTAYFLGGLGPGSYFTPLFIQHLLIFPLILALKNRLTPYPHYGVIFGFFAACLFLEWLCLSLNISDSLYRLLYVRYIFAAILGSYLVTHPFSRPVVLGGALASAVYIAHNGYFSGKNYLIDHVWGIQHAPDYFYTLLIVISLWNLYPWLANSRTQNILDIGKASYHIFLVQMVYFYGFSVPLRDLLHNYGVYLICNLIICLLGGYGFYKLNLTLEQKLSHRAGATLPRSLK